MKTRHIVSSIILGASLMFTSCEGFLNVQQIGKSTINTFFTDISSFIAAGEGLHNDYSDFYQDVIMYGDIAGNQLKINTVNASQASKLTFNFELRPEHNATYEASIWKSGYEVVSSANYLITYGEKYLETCKESDKDHLMQVIGWAYLLRSMAIFDLCRVYAQTYTHTPDASHIGVPLVDHIPGFDDEIERSTVAEDYDFILNGVKKAVSYLESVTSPYTASTLSDYSKIHVSLTSADAFLARVYLTMEDWENAEKHSAKVMETVRLSGRDEYVNMFRNPRKYIGEESIFRLDPYGHSTSFLSKYDPTSTNTDFSPDPKFIDSFSSDDVRKELFYYIPEDIENEVFHGRTYEACCKHLRYKSNSSDDDKHPLEFVFRASEMYLTHAEAVCKGGGSLEEAAKDVRAIMERATGKPVSFAFSSQSDLERIIENERAKELCNEGHSFFDFKRQKKDIVRNPSSNALLLTLTYPDYRFVLPIDEMEMQANDNMIQNEGY